MQTLIDPNLLQRLRVGPLAPYLDAYLKRIEQESFSRSSVPMQMYAIVRFSNWLHGRKLDLTDSCGAIPGLSAVVNLRLCVAFSRCCVRSARQWQSRQNPGAVSNDS